MLVRLMPLTTCQSCVYQSWIIFGHVVRPCKNRQWTTTTIETLTKSKPLHHTRSKRLDENVSLPTKLPYNFQSIRLLHVDGNWTLPSGCNVIVDPTSNLRGSRLPFYDHESEIMNCETQYVQFTLSILKTSAPWSARIIPQTGAGARPAISRTWKIRLTP